MKITSGSVSLASSHAYQRTEKSATVTIRKAAEPSKSIGHPISKTDTVREAGKELVGTENKELLLLKTLVEQLTGKKIETFADISQKIAERGTHAEQLSTSEVQDEGTSQSETPGIVISASIIDESESTSFAAEGTVTTADGRSISFFMSESMSRSEHREALTIEPEKKDPLFLDFGNARLGTEKTQVGVGDNAFSLNSVHGNGGFLVYDRNGNGKIDGKSELFGPDSGNGFADLSKLDEDRNGWIDENDAAFSKLSLWNNGHLSGASSAGVGAISLSNVATPFTLKDGTNSIGDIVSTGVFLSENGKVGEIRQIDLSA